MQSQEVVRLGWHTGTTTVQGRTGSARGSARQESAARESGGGIVTEARGGARCGAPCAQAHPKFTHGNGSRHYLFLKT